MHASLLHSSYELELELPLVELLELLNDPNIAVNAAPWLWSFPMASSIAVN